MKQATNGLPTPTFQGDAIDQTGAQAVLEALLEEGVNTIFGYPGGAIIPVYDALYDYTPFLTHITVRHEQGAIHAAQGYARVSGRTGVCLATSGPGATNLVTGIADAMMDSTPVVCIVGQVNSNLLGTNAFQEVDMITLTQPITKWNYELIHPDEIPGIIAKAFHIARSGRPGPVVISITKDAQLMPLQRQVERRLTFTSKKPPLPDPTPLQRAADFLNEATFPFILAGQGILLAKATNELVNLAETMGSPVATTLLGQSAFPTDHSLYTGWLGMHGTYASNMLTTKCDVIIAIGMRFDERVTGDPNAFATQAKIVHIDIDPAEIGKVIQPEVALVGDAKEILRQLIPLLKAHPSSNWQSHFTRYQSLESEKITRRELAPTTQKIKMAEVIAMLSDKTAGNAVLVTDVGQHQMKASRYYQFRRTHSLITSGGFGTMGFALPAAIGAKVGAPDRDIIVVVGDGGFQMTLKELATIAHYGWPIKIILLNNNYLGMVRQWQQLFFDHRYSFVHLQNPDFMTIARGFAIDSKQCSQRELLSASLDDVLASHQPFLLEVIVEQEENVFPMFPAGGRMDQIRLE
ncbi:biosynthetic-type acetolactate synthase large subunit [Spirosoma litoris]